MVRVVIVFRVRVSFYLSIQSREIGGNISLFLFALTTTDSDTISDQLGFKVHRLSASLSKTVPSLKYTFRTSCYSTHLTWAHTPVMSWAVCLGQ